MRVLLTNTALAHRTGSELYVAEVARGLARRGHRPAVYSPVVGPLGEALRADGIPVASRLAELGARPDVIHAQHHLQAMAALLFFPGVPGLYVCHGALPFEEAPPLHPRLLRYVAVDEAVRGRLREAGVPEERTRLLLSFVDLERFTPRPPLPARPRRALVLSNNAREETHLPAVRAACTAEGISLEAAGIACGSPAEAPERLLPEFDLVFAKGRAALEALAVGCAVVVCDAAGAGPLVTSAELSRLRALNFGFRLLERPLAEEPLRSEIARYDASDAALVRDRIRAEAGLEEALGRLETLYAEVLSEAAAAPADAEAERRAAAFYLEGLDPALKERGRALDGLADLWRRVESLTAQVERLSPGPGLP